MFAARITPSHLARSLRRNSAKSSGLLPIGRFANEGLSLPRRSVVCGSTHMNNALLATGRYLAIYPGSLMQIAAKRLSVVVLPVKLRVRPSSVGIVTLKHRTISPVAQRFIDCAHEIGRTMPFVDSKTRPNNPDDSHKPGRWAPKAGRRIT